MVHHVVEKHHAKRHGSGVLGDHVLAEAELPQCGKMPVAGVGEGGTALGGRFVQPLQAGFPRTESKVGLRTFTIRHIHALIFQDVVSEQRQRRAMHSQLAHLHRLLMRCPVRLSLGDTFNRAAGVRHLNVVVLEKNFGNGHAIGILFGGD